MGQVSTMSHSGSREYGRAKVKSAIVKVLALYIKW